MLPTHWKIAGTVCTSFTVILLAQAAELIKPNIRPGLWEVTSNSQFSGTLPIPEDTLARLTPEQRAKLEAVMQASTAKAARPRSYRSCMTPEKLARGFDTAEQKNSSCQRTVLASSASEIDVRDECSSANGKATIDARFQLVGAEQLAGTVNVVSTSGGKTMTMNNTIHGKWLSASCGDIKDVEIEK